MHFSTYADHTCLLHGYHATPLVEAVNCYSNGFGTMFIMPTYLPIFGQRLLLANLIARGPSFLGQPLAQGAEPKESAALYRCVFMCLATETISGKYDWLLRGNILI